LRYRYRVRGISNVIAVLYVLLIVLGTIGFIVYIDTSVSNTMSYIAKYLSSISRKSAELEGTITVYPTSLNITLINRSPEPIVIVSYYVRDVNTTAIIKGNTYLEVPVSTPVTLGIPGNFSSLDHYVVVLVDSNANLYRFLYPQAQKTSAPKWELRLIPVVWNPAQPYGSIATAYSVDNITGYPGSYTVNTGTYLSGSLANLTALDGVYFTVQSKPVASTSTAYFPSALSVTTGVPSGLLSYLQANDNTYYLTIRALPSSFANTIYFTNQTTSIGGTTYYELRIQQPNAPYLLSATVTTSVTGTFVVGDFAYPISAYAGYTIPASTWYVYYYSWYSVSGFAFARATAYINILVMYTNGTTVTIASNFAPATLSTTQAIYTGSGAFPGLTVTSDMAYLIIQYRVSISTTVLFGSVTFYAYINDGSSGISASGAWASAYAVNATFTGISNTAEQWLSLFWGADMHASVYNVSGYLSLYDYALGAYRTLAPGYISITNMTLTDTFYNETITVNPAEFRNSTGGFSIRLYLSRPVQWNEGFTVYIDYMPFEPTYYNTYEATVTFTVPNLPTSNIYRVEVDGYIVHNTTVSSFTASLYSYATGTWTTLYSGSGQNFTVSSTLILQPSQYISATGTAMIRLDSVLVSQNAWNFTQSSDLLKIVVYVYGAPSIVVLLSGTDYLTVYKYVSNQTSTYLLPLTVTPGGAVTASGSTAFIVYGGNTANFTVLDLVNGTATNTLLPVNSTYSILVAGDLIYYFPDALTSNTYYTYNITSGLWSGPYTYPLNPPIYACTYNGELICVNGTDIAIPSAAGVTYTLLPEYVQPVGLSGSIQTGDVYLVYPSGDIYQYISGTWVKLAPSLPAIPVSTNYYGNLLTQTPSTLFYLRLLTRELYSIPKTSLVPG